MTCEVSQAGDFPENNKGSQEGPPVANKISHPKSIEAYFRRAKDKNRKERVKIEQLMMANKHS